MNRHVEQHNQSTVVVGLQCSITPQREKSSCQNFCLSISYNFPENTGKLFSSTRLSASTNPERAVRTHCNDFDLHSSPANLKFSLKDTVQYVFFERPCILSVFLFFPLWIRNRQHHTLLQLVYHNGQFLPSPSMTHELAQHRQQWLRSRSYLLRCHSSNQHTSQSDIVSTVHHLNLA